ncbi:hypothetical protein B0H67DRAFT_646243 [Lasiosphaeris hirsuta]|uniref:Transmembrane protein n=1 Tax=Lasiosphaeris hirsuta TaxID=260670 RepID=A0AA40A7P1_9PEZI|nr:hypothetical protein B0H67DRAFT_646243 [Lasiosphaeris hirsuta]
MIIPVPGILTTTTPSWTTTPTTAASIHAHYAADVNPPAVLPRMGNTTSGGANTVSSFAQDTIFGVFSVVLACATLVVAAVQVIHFRTHRGSKRRDQDRENEEGLAAAVVVPLRALVLPGGASVTSLTDATLVIVPKAAASQSAAAARLAKPLRIDSGIAVDDL